MHQQRKTASAEKDCINQLLEAHQDVFQGVGILKGDQVQFHIDHSVPPGEVPGQAANQNEHKHVGGNKALRRIAHHVETIQEMRHFLKGATHYSEMDLSHRFNQIALQPDSCHISTFRIHEGLHVFKVFF